MTTEEGIVEAAIDLGKKKMVLEVKDRCSYPGIMEERKIARHNYEQSKQVFLEMIREMVKRG